RDIGAPKQAVAGDARGGIVEHLDAFVDVERKAREVGVAVERNVAHHADLYAGDAHIGADGDAVDALEARGEVIAATAAALPGLRSGEGEEAHRDHGHNRAQDGFAP